MLPTSAQLSALAELQTVFEQAGPLALAVSGGLDSRFLSLVCSRLGLDALCVHFKGPHVPASESERAEAWMRGLGLEYRVLDVDPLVLSEVAANTRERCYHCKRLLFETLMAAAPGRVVMDGGNASDLGKFRPGMRALAELGVRSPMAECGISKPDIQALGEHLGLAEPRQPATPCLLTRLPYDSPVDREALARIEALEEACRKAGFTRFRVRLVDGEPLLFAHPDQQGLEAPLPVRWTEAISGFWDS
ncbi:ATP-dependent sacrificial sulfur transferase LarE [Desulfocurvus sp. DL9XJH121]